ncbi:hypothetical protein HRI_001235200 [Hibiscus trionum]|uniref:Uncharacterized protein n=1 Tax=Hibiscus trionum TaxID=183268 RepID=A0A9W7HDR3_HIBTR|nr:hypothetical protein HRI_001235200 [Hibiscus trionum]
MERQSDGTCIKKGPWTAEEDEILMNYVKKYGPRGWSSIRSMGLLPRTGKSCRLRWVNKLRPNLKTGCKFSAEEERAVIELQAEFGNKWAKIARHLPGRTDNDVKNFWSARRKRLDRISQTQENKGKDPVPHEMPMVEVLPANFVQGSSSHEDQFKRSLFMEEFQMVSLPDLIKPDLLNLETGLPVLDIEPIRMIPLDLPILPECQDLALESFDYNCVGMFNNQSESKPKSLTKIPSAGSHAELGNKENDAAPDCFFDEFPTDMFDYLEPLPSSLEW